MTPAESVAYIHAQSVAAYAEIEAMKAANSECEMRGQALAYGEDAFLAVIDRYSISHNAVITIIQGAY